MTTADGSRITKFTGSQQGPAFMLSLKLDSGTKVDIDLVAAFSFEPQSFQKFPGKWIIPENANRQFFNPNRQENLVAFILRNNRLLKVTLSQDVFSI